MNHRGLTARYALLQDITHVTDQFKVVARGTIQCSWSFLQYISARHFEAFLILCAISLYSWLDHWALLKPKFIN